MCRCLPLLSSADGVAGLDVQRVQEVVPQGFEVGKLNFVPSPQQIITFAALGHEIKNRHVPGVFLTGTLFFGDKDLNNIACRKVETPRPVKRMMPKRKPPSVGIYGAVIDQAKNNVSTAKDAEYHMDAGDWKERHRLGSKKKRRANRKCNQIPKHKKRGQKTKGRGLPSPSDPNAIFASLDLVLPVQGPIGLAFWHGVDHVRIKPAAIVTTVTRVASAAAGHATLVAGTFVYKTFVHGARSYGQVVLQSNSIRMGRNLKWAVLR